MNPSDKKNKKSKFLGKDKLFSIIALFYQSHDAGRAYLTDSGFDYVYDFKVLSREIFAMWNAHNITQRRSIFHRDHLGNVPCSLR
ncbi:MAG: hypothetical protein PHR06_11010 [Candidatus Cloacimonetes bacterium]|nr:hypothetical protein [Candidatus Cloacimonadota bacterium]